jgi:hypothetical protein
VNNVGANLSIHLERSAASVISRDCSKQSYYLRTTDPVGGNTATSFTVINFWTSRFLSTACQWVGWVVHH